LKRRRGDFLSPLMLESWGRVPPKEKEEEKQPTLRRGRELGKKSRGGEKELIIREKIASAYLLGLSGGKGSE